MPIHLLLALATTAPGREVVDHGTLLSRLRRLVLYDEALHQDHQYLAEKRHHHLARELVELNHLVEAG